MIDRLKGSGPSRSLVDRGHGAGSSLANERVFVLEEIAGGLEGLGILASSQDVENTGQSPALCLGELGDPMVSTYLGQFGRKGNGGLMQYFIRAGHEKDAGAQGDRPAR